MKNNKNNVLDTDETIFLVHEYFKTKDLETRNRIAEICEPAIRYYIRFLYNSHKLPSHITEDDLYGDASIGLIYGIETFNPNKGSTFKSWVLTNMWAAIIDYIRKNSFGGKYHYKEYQLVPIDSVAQNKFAPDNNRLNDLLDARIDLVRLLNKALRENEISFNMKNIFLSRHLLHLDIKMISNLTGLSYNSVVGYIAYTKKKLIKLALEENKKCTV
jgi:RNA polymerase sigma factor (sigma-70 family)